MSTAALTDSARTWVNAQTDRLLAIGWKFRWVGGLVVAGFAGVLALLGGADWQPYIVPLLVYSAVMAACARFARSRTTLGLAPVAAVLDVALITFVQSRSMPASPHPAGVAGFSLGLFCMLICINGLAMRSTVTWATAGFATFGQMYLMHQAGVGFGAQAIAAAVLGATAGASERLALRLIILAATLSRAEVEKQMQERRFAEVESARRTIEQMLNEAREHAAQLELLQRERDVLTQVLVHDLRSPLNVVGLNASWVAEQLPGNLPPDVAADANDALEQVQVVTRRLTGMVNDMLNIAKLEHHALPLTADAMSVESLLKSVQKQFGVMARERGVAIEVDCSVGTIRGDRSLLTRVFENLASNAMRYTPAGGRVLLFAQADETGAVQLAVRNDGEVIPHKVRGQLFDKFQQLGDADERRSAGFGLGLYFCRLVAQAHHGSIAVEDADGWATSMVLRFPSAAALPLAA